MANITEKIERQITALEGKIDSPQRELSDKHMEAPA